MQLKTPRRYRGGRQKKRLFGSWRWLRNLILIGIFGYVGYWIFQHPTVFREEFQGFVDRINEEGSGLKDSLAEPTATPDMTNILLQADLAYSTGDFEQAIQDYRQAIVGAPNNLDAHFRLAYLLVITSDFGDNTRRIGEAIEVGEKAINAVPEAGTGWAIYGMALLWGGRDGEAMAAILRALELEPDNLMAQAFLAEVYQRLDEDELAITTIRDAEASLRERGSAPNEVVAQVFRTMGYILERQLDRDGAIQAYEYAIERAPHQSYIALELAASYLGNGQAEQSQQLLQASLDSNPRDTGLLYQLALMYVYVGNGEEARNTLQSCLNINPEKVSCLSLMGGLQFYAGEYTQAIPNLQQAIDNGSTDPDDWRQLGRAYYHLLDCASAIPILREGYQMTEEGSELKERLAEDLRDCGAFAQ